jgi:hypothetical protein
MSDTCLFVGDPVNSGAFLDITLINPRGRPTVSNGSWPFIDAIAARQIVDEVKFKDGISKIIDGTVACLNASIWAKPAQQ